MFAEYHSLGDLLQPSLSTPQHQHITKAWRWSTTNLQSLVQTSNLCLSQLPLWQHGKSLFPLYGVFLHANIINCRDHKKWVTSKSTFPAHTLAFKIAVTKMNTCYTQDHVSASFHTLMGECNIIDKGFSKAKGGILNCHDGITFLTWAHFRTTLHLQPIPTNTHFSRQRGENCTSTGRIDGFYTNNSHTHFTCSKDTSSAHNFEHFPITKSYHS